MLISKIKCKDNAIILEIVQKPNIPFKFNYVNPLSKTIKEIEDFLEVINRSKNE